LPDPLVLLDGTKVTTREQWFDKRRPELKQFFQTYMYGKLPAPRKVEAEVVHEDPKAFDGKATLREIALHVGSKGVPPMYVLLVVPNERKGPAPCFVGMNFTGNHTLVKDPKVREATKERRGSAIAAWSLEQSVERGYAVATVHTADVDPDRKDPRGPLYKDVVNPPEGERPGDQTATIMFWAWGLHRIVDHLVTLKEIDPKRIAVAGHSRLGKTALVAAAFDERIALAIPHQAGCGGTGPSRSKNPRAETVKRINTAFPHWFCDNFKKFNDHVEKLPFDQNCLVALCAPRAVLFTNAEGDQWANPGGQFDVLKSADPVYRLLGAGGLETKEMPAQDKLSDGTLGYFIRAGNHSTTKEDWKVFLAFADKHLRR
jgi:hypothetical protein